MDWYIVLPSALFVLLGLLFCGLPIFVAFFVLNLAGLLIFIGPRGFGLLINSVYETGTSTLLTAIPLFIVMSEILFRSGSVDVLFNSMNKLIGRIHGRLYYFVIALSTIFGALSGSGIAVTAMLSKSAIPVMERLGYDRRFSIAMVLGGACLAPIIPPSTLAVIIGSIADVSISKLLIAGIVPGLVLAMIFAVYVAITMKFKPHLAPRDTDEGITTWRIRIVSLANCLPFSIVIFGVMGVILLGIATASESAATGVVASLLTAAYYRKLSMSLIIESIKSAVITTAIIMAIMVSSKLFTQLLSFAGATSGLVAAVASLPIGGMEFVWVTMAVTFVMCMFMDQIAFMLLAIPMLQPLLKTFGLNPVWFWELFLINLSLGSLTPPFGYDLFTLKALMPHFEMKLIFGAAWKIVWIIVLGMLLFALVPSLVTFLPSLM